MNTKTMLATLVVLASMVIGTVSIGGSASAAKSSAANGIETADVNVHENTEGLGGSQDVRFHEGLCQADISSEALDTANGGCNPPLITPPGNSESKP
jgi:hypothetical protein